MFCVGNGLPCLKNLKMDELSHLLTGEALLNANVFWKAIESQPIVTLENGQTWSFERVQMEMAGKAFTKSPARISPRKRGSSGKWKRTIFA